MANSEKCPDFDLVDACQKGDSEAFTELVTRYQNRIFNTILRMIGNYETALDLTQETFLRAYQNLTGFQKKSAFFTWLFRIAINIATSKRRQYARRPRKFCFSQYDSGETAGPKIEPPDKQPLPQDTLVQREMQSLVQQEISALPDEFRQVLVLRDIEGLSYEDIHLIIDCPIGTVRSRLHRARAMLKDRLSQFYANQELP